VSRPTQDRTRFAPSPTGLLHLGHAFAAIHAHDAAGYGNFILRIEDLDSGRARAEFTVAIFEDLKWLGLSWELPVLSQSTRGDAYRAALLRLQERGMIYPCFCTRRQIADELSRAAEAPHAEGLQAAIYPGTCRALSGEQREQRLADGQPYALRLDSAKAAEACPQLSFEEYGHGPKGERGTVRANPLLFGDVVLARKNLPAAYHLAVVVDDAYQGVTRVTRGNDLFSSTHVQRTLQALLELPAPRYAHHRLIFDEQGRKFSKRDQAVTLRSLREAGVTPGQIRSRLGAALS
jgi:glutamyl-Q tRNA(Asp) synthetase